jgi:hypothetical protein
MVDIALLFIPWTPPFLMAPRAWNHFNNVSHEGKMPVRLPNRIRLDPDAEPERWTRARQNRRKMRCDLHTHFAEELKFQDI